ncbi:MAG TPA: malate synthase A, partial [Calditrichia bacterium]|nr:malate synthase A [Calditrichia bacterium]
TCHKRGAHAIGGMAAFIPSRRDEEVNRVALAKVAEDKKRESEDGFDGTWIAHPDLVETASREFVKVLGDRPHQKERMREDVQVGAADLRNFTIRGGKVTEGGVRQNINVALLYLESWLRGTGAAALYNLMEDAATAEISRAQLWQWVHTPEVKLDDGRPVNEALYREFLPEELKTIRGLVGEDYFAAGRFPEAVEILNELVLSEKFPEFLTLLAYKRLR